MKFPLAEVLATNYSPRVMMLLVEGAVAPMDITKQAEHGYDSCLNINMNVNQNSSISCWTRHLLLTDQPVFHTRFKSITISNQKYLPHHQKPSSNHNSS